MEAKTIEQDFLLVRELVPSMHDGSSTGAVASGDKCVFIEQIQRNTRANPQEWSFRDDSGAASNWIIGEHALPLGLAILVVN